MSELDQRHPVLRPRRLTVSGGSKLEHENAIFCEYLGRRLAAETGVVIVTGGLKGVKNQQGSQSADWSTIKGVLSIRTDEFQVETLLPAKEKDWSELERFDVGNTIRLHQRSAQARRFALVNSVDAVVTIEGGKGTGEVIDLALTIERPVFPIPFTGGVSAQRWKENRETIQEWFGIPESEMQHIESLRLGGVGEEEFIEAADAVAKYLVKGLRRKCFVMMPFSNDIDEIYESDKVYESGIFEALRAHEITPVRTDRLNLTGDILDTIRHGISTCDAALADITGFNPNVMYELGLAHAQNKPVIIICKSDSGSRAVKLPFDIMTHQVIWYQMDFEALSRDIRNCLTPIFGEFSNEKRVDRVVAVRSGPATNNERTK